MYVTKCHFIFMFSKIKKCKMDMTFLKICNISSHILQYGNLTISYKFSPYSIITYIENYLQNWRYDECKDATNIY